MKILKVAPKEKKRDSPHVIKVRILRGGIILDYLAEPNITSVVFIRGWGLEVRVKEGDMMVELVVGVMPFEDGGRNHSQGTPGVSGIWKRQRNNSPLNLQKEYSSANSVILGLLTSRAIR